MEGQLRPIEVAAAADEEDRAAGAGTDDARVPDRAADQEAAIEIVGGHTAVVVVVHDLTVKAHAESPALAANLKTGKKTVVPSQGTEVIERCATTAVNRCTWRECRVICLENKKVFYYPLYLEQHCRTFTFFYHLHINYDDALVGLRKKNPELILM